MGEHIGGIVHQSQATDLLQNPTAILGAGQAGIILRCGFKANLNTTALCQGYCQREILFQPLSHLCFSKFGARFLVLLRIHRNDHK